MIVKVDGLFHVWVTFYSLLISSQVPNLYVNNFFEEGGIYMPKDGRKGGRMQKKEGREVFVIILFS